MRSRGGNATIGWLSTTVLGLALGACGAPADAPARPETSRLGAHGLVEFVAEPESDLVEGPNRFRVSVRDADTDEPLDGAELSAEAVMRSMGHDAPDSPAISELAPGAYQLDDVVFTMPGLWELRLAASTDAIYDEAGFLFEVP
jgi:hypothetical protein